VSRLSKKQLLSKVKQAITESDWNFRVISSDRFLEHPFLLEAYSSEAAETLRVYIWNITHGGATRAEDEYRIQITGVDKIDVTPSFKSLLIGWDNQHRVFAGFNVSRYTTFGASPSLQIKEGVLSEAEKQGFSMQAKEYDEEGEVSEVVVVFKPEFFMVYATNLDNYHKSHLTLNDVKLMKQAVSKPLDEEELDIRASERKRVIRQHNDAIRDRKFSIAVLQVYDHKCAICGLQLHLIEAARIVAVKDGGSDEVQNGLALCPNHHKAFDLGLFLIDANYKTFLVSDKIKAVKRGGRISGLDNFMEGLRIGEMIFLPDDVRFSPNRDFIDKRLSLLKTTE